MSTHVQFRQYIPSDKEQVCQLHEVALRDTNAFGKSGQWDSDLDDIEGKYLNNGGNFVVGLLNADIIAMGAFRKLSDEAAELKRMRVRPDLQGKGIGRGLLEMLEASIKDHGYKVIKLDTTVNQSAAIHLYESAGYREVSRSIQGWPTLPLETIFFEKQIV